MTAQQIREQVPLWRPARPGARQVVRRQRLDRAAGAHPARRRGRDRPRRERRPLAHLAAALDADGGLAGRRTRPAMKADEGYAELVRRWLRSFGPGTEADLVWWLGGTKARGPRRAGLGRGGRGLARRRRHRLGAPRRRGPGGRGRAVGGAAAGARPDGDGLEGARLLPRSARPAPLRHQRQRRDDGLVGRPGRRRAGCRTQDGVVEVRPLEKLPEAARTALDAEAARLTDWLDGHRVSTVYPSSAMKAPAPGIHAMTREQPKQAPPPVQRLRVRYAKRGRLRFTSHRDFSRAFERAVFRARLPMAYSSGFNPHPRISYAGAAPTGSASEAEYLELALAEVLRPRGRARRARRGAARRPRRGRGRRGARRSGSPSCCRSATGSSASRCRSPRRRRRSRPSWPPTRCWCSG